MSVARDSGAAAYTPIFVLCFFHAERENLESRYNTSKNLCGFLVNWIPLKKKKANKTNQILCLNEKTSVVLFWFAFLMLCNFQKAYLDLQSVRLGRFMILFCHMDYDLTTDNKIIPT